MDLILKSTTNYGAHGRDQFMRLLHLIALLSGCSLPRIGTKTHKLFPGCVKVPVYTDGKITLSNLEDVFISDDLLLTDLFLVEKGRISSCTSRVAMVNPATKKRLSLQPSLQRRYLKDSYFRRRITSLPLLSLLNLVAYWTSRMLQLGSCLSPKICSCFQKISISSSLLF